MSATSLDELEAVFRRWRASRKQGARVPEDLWYAVTKVCDRHPPSVVSRRLGLDYYHLKERLSRAPKIASLTCSKVVKVASPVPPPLAHQSNVHPLCEAAFPSGIIVRFFSDCESLRALVSQGWN
jgi:hypothetical protein